MTLLDDNLIKEIRKQYSEEAIYLLSDFPKKDVSAISTGSLLLDTAIGVGGVPKGRVTEIYGPDGAGKTTLCQHIIANAHRQGELAAFIDVEHALDPRYAERCGVDFNRVYLSQPNFAEEALGIIDKLATDGGVSVIVLDSVAALSPEVEAKEEDFKDVNTTGMIRAKLLGVLFRRIKNHLQANDVALVVTNQMRDNTKSFFGGLKRTGGWNLKHYASVRISLWPTEVIKEGSQEVGQIIDATIKKNKVARPFRKAKFAILGDRGIDRVADIFTTSRELNLIKQARSYFKYEGEVLAQGQAKTIAVLRENPELLDELENLCREMLAEEN